MHCTDVAYLAKWKSKKKEVVFVSFVFVLSKLGCHISIWHQCLLEIIHRYVDAEQTSKTFRDNVSFPDELSNLAVEYPLVSTTISLNLQSQDSVKVGERSSSGKKLHKSTVTLDTAC